MRNGLVMLAATGSALLGACSSDTGDGLSNAGKHTESLTYTEIRPPSGLTPVGTVVLVRARNPLQLQLICRAPDVLGGRDVVTDSGTVSSNWTASHGGSASLSASYLAKVNASLGGEYVKTGHYTLSNARLYEIADSDLIDVLSGGAVKQSCLEAITARRNENPDAVITLVQASLVGDVVYTLDFDSSVGVDVKIAALEKLAPTLNAKLTNGADGELRGDGLIWGIRDDRNLLHRIEVGDVTESSPVPEQVLPTDQPAEIVLTPNVPSADASAAMPPASGGMQPAGNPG